MQETKNKASDKDEAEFMDPRVYEVGYLLVPTISEEDVPAEHGNLKELVASLGGQMISDEMPIMIPLAYSMLKVVSNVRSKFDKAYFGWVKFYLDPEQATMLKKKLDQDPKIIRFLIIKTVKENTIASKRFVQREGARRKAPGVGEIKKEGEGETLPINKEEIDKEIDAMIEA